MRTTVLALALVAVPSPAYIYGDWTDGEVLHHRVNVHRIFDYHHTDQVDIYRNAMCL